MHQMELEYSEAPTLEEVPEQKTSGMTSNRILTTSKGTKIRTIRRLGGSLWLVEVLSKGGFYTAPIDINELTQSPE